MQAILASNRPAWSLCALTSLLLSITATSAGTTLYVDDDAPAGGDGEAWETAYRFLQNALDAANPGSGVDEIHIAQGLYCPDRDEAHPAGSGDRDATFALINAVAVMGSYAGIGAPDPDARDTELYESVLSGDLDGNDEAGFVNYGENSYHVVSGHSVSSIASMDGLTISGGNANGTIDPRQQGGGMRSLAGDAAISNCIFTFNRADERGGAAYIAGSESIITDCVFSDNYCGYVGGGLFNATGSETTINGCVFLNNHAEERGGGAANLISDTTMKDCSFLDNTAELYGAGLYNDQCGPSIINCLFEGNVSGHFGAGMDNLSATPFISWCEFRNNTVTDPIYGGGGLSIVKLTATVTNCTFEGNHAGNGGGVYTNLSNPSFTFCEFVENTAVSAGGGMYCADTGNPVLLTCEFDSNVAEEGNGGGICSTDNCVILVANTDFNANWAQDSGGGVYTGTNGGDLINCEFTGNHANLDGGGLRAYTGPARLMNCMFAGNSAGDDGGGFSCAASDEGDVINCTFLGNTAAAEGGAIYNFMSNTNIVNCSICENSASGGGGAVFSYYDCEPLVTNCILWGNTPDQIDTFDAQTVVAYCDVDGGWSGDGFGNIDADPLFVDLAAGDLHLLPGSPCIDAGSNWGVPRDIDDLDYDGKRFELHPEDFDGDPRFADDPATTDTGCGFPFIVDMGAFETPGDHGEIFLADISGDGSVDVLDLLAVLTNWGPGGGDCTADLDMSGEVDVLDLVTILSLWGVYK